MLDYCSIRHNSDELNSFHHQSKPKGQPWIAGVKNTTKDALNFNLVAIATVVHALSTKLGSLQDVYEQALPQGHNFLVGI